MYNLFLLNLEKIFSMICQTQFTSLTDGEHIFQEKHFYALLDKHTILNTCACTYMYSQYEA